MKKKMWRALYWNVEKLWYLMQFHGLDLQMKSLWVPSVINCAWKSIPKQDNALEFLNATELQLVDRRFKNAV